VQVIVAAAPVTAAPVLPATAPVPPSGRTAILPVTGGRTGPLLVLGLALVAAGAGVLALRDRRSARTGGR
jgi:LPXTG-motif cell wall-anchored protein